MSRSILIVLTIVLASCGAWLGSSRRAADRGPAPVRTSASESRPVVATIDRLPAGATLDVTLATAETTYRREGEDRPRAHNVELAARYLDGQVIAPGAVFSFNGAVGARSHARGFAKAHVIQDGELVDGWGGGTCQVASTLHTAALRAGLEIVEGRPHSRPSHYLAPGYDATVVWPSVDLKLRNPFAYPVLVRARGEAGTLAVELVGATAAPAVRIETQVLSRQSYQERIVDDPELATGEMVLTQLGQPGLFVRRTRIVGSGSEARTEVQTLHYPPTDRIIHRGVGT